MTQILFIDNERGRNQPTYNKDLFQVSTNNQLFNENSSSRNSKYSVKSNLFFKGSK